MKHRYKEKCDVCGSWSKQYRSHKNMIVCDKCYEDRQGKFELAEPVQITLDEALRGEEE